MLSDILDGIENVFVIFLFKPSFSKGIWNAYSYLVAFIFKDEGISKPGGKVRFAELQFELTQRGLPKLVGIHKENFTTSQRDA